MVGMDFKNFKPCLLIAMPDLKDSDFAKSVVLLCDYQPEGAVGIVINSKTNLTLNEALSFSKGALLPEYLDFPLYTGGPVDAQRIWIVCEKAVYPQFQGQDLGGGVGLIEEGDILIEDKVVLTRQQLRVFHGYAGWGVGQLEAEIAKSFWLTAPITRELVFLTPLGEIWEKAILGLGIDPTHLQGAGDTKVLN